MSSLVEAQIEATLKLVSPLKGAMECIRGTLWSRVDHWVKLAATMNNTTEEAIREVAEQFLDAKNITANDCKAIDRILGMRQVIIASGEPERLHDFEMAMERMPIDMGTQIKTFIHAAKVRSVANIIYTWKNLASLEEYPEEQKIAALVAFGMPEEKARKCTWRGNTVAYMGVEIDFFSLAGVDSGTGLPYFYQE